YTWQPRGPQDLGVTSAHTELIPFDAVASPLVMPGLGDIAPKPALTALQVVPGLTSPGPEPSAALALTAYSIGNLLHSGTNLIRVRVRSGKPPAVLLASAMV